MGALAGDRLALFRHFYFWLFGRAKWFRGKGLGFAAVGLDAFQLVGGVAEVALDAGDLALHAAEGLVAAGVGVADFGVVAVAVAFAPVVDGADPHLVFGGADAAEAPGVVDDVVDEFALAGVSGLPAGGEFFDEDAEFFGVFAGDHEGFGIDTGFEGIKADGGFAFGGSGSGGLLGVSTVCFYLFNGGHRLSRFYLSRRVSGKKGKREIGIENKGNKDLKICD